MSAPRVVDTVQGSLAGLGILLAIGMLVGGSLYGCQMQNNQYYGAQRQCIEAGGSFVPTDSSYGAACVGSIRRSAS